MGELCNAIGKMLRMASRAVENVSQSASEMRNVLTALVCDLVRIVLLPDGGGAKLLPTVGG